ncbi:MAG TPA: hypothetical protein VLK25_04560 [Allosphingosinicella sp.]|nr:hypothetical protein [Allosphingosinicella sp.]
MKLWLALLLPTAPAAAQAQAADEFCAGLNRIVAAARETDPFASVDAERPNRVLAFASFCFKVQFGAVRFSCIADRPGTEVTREGVAAEVRRCLPAALPDPAPDAEDPHSKDTRLLADGVPILIMAREFAEGRTVSLVVWPPRD